MCRECCTGPIFGPVFAVRPGVRVAASALRAVSCGCRGGVGIAVSGASSTGGFSPGGGGRGKVFRIP